MTVEAMRKGVDHNPRAATRTDRDIGRRIRVRRIEQKLTQQEFAKALGVTFQQIQKYETGANRVSGARLLEICQALELDPNQLLGWHGKVLKSQ